MKALTNILNYILLLMMILIASCTEDTAEVDDLVRGEEYVTVRMQVPGMKNATTRADEAEDNITSVWALTYRDTDSDDNLELVSKTEITTESTLIPSTSTTGTFNLSRPKVNDVIHFLANVPSDVTSKLPVVGTEESELCGLTTRDYANLSYWGKANYTGGETLDVTLYRNMAMITIAPDPDGGCTFPEDQLFIAGLVKPNQEGTLVPYDTENGAFNFDLDEHDYPTLPAVPDPSDATPLLDNYGEGFENYVYALEHDNPNTSDGLYVICKIGKYYYKVALIDDTTGQPYDIVRNHRYVIYVKDLDEVVYDDGLTEEEKYQLAVTSDPINLKVIETTDLVFNYSKNPTVYLNGGASSTLPVQITVPQDASLTEFNISATGFAVTASSGTVSGSEGSYTYAGGSTTFTFTPNSGLAADTYTIELSGSGNYLHDFTETIIVTVDATMMAVTAKDSDATLDMDGGDTGVTLVLTQPGNVDNVEVSVSADVFDVANTDNEYTFTPKNSNIAAGEYTVTFADSNYPQVSTTTTITVVNTPKVTFTNTSDKTLYWNNGSPTNFQVPMNGVPNDKSVTLSITGAEAFTITDANSNELQLDGDNYTYTGGNTTFTIKPKDANSVSDDDYTIGFSGTGDGVNVVPAEVIVTVKASNSALFATSDTINMDNRETYTTITLTKPTNVQNIKVTFDANTFIINDNQGDTNNDYWINNNSNSTIDIKFTIRNNNVAAGTYNVTFTDNGQMSATATITVVNTPKVTFTNTSDKTLYWNKGKPTSFDVEMTVPNDGSVTLSINAAAFTVTKSSESSGTLSGPSNGVYTYTGGNTTFTITPASAESVNANPHTIRITGTGEGVIVPNTPIKVTVGETAPSEIVLWGNGEGEGNWDNWNNNNRNLKDKVGNISDYYKLDYKIKVYFTTTQSNAQFSFRTGSYQVIDKQYSYTEIVETSCTLDITETALQKIQNEGGMVQIVASYINVTKISVIAP